MWGYGGGTSMEPPPSRELKPFGAFNAKHNKLLNDLTTS